MEFLILILVLGRVVSQHTQWPILIRMQVARSGKAGSIFSGKTETFVSAFRKDVETLVGVQKRFTRMFPRLVGINHKERLDGLGLFSLA